MHITKEQKPSKTTELMLGTWVAQSESRPRALFIAPKSRNDGFHRRCRCACSGDLRELVCMQTNPDPRHGRVEVAKLQTRLPRMVVVGKFAGNPFMTSFCGKGGVRKLPRHAEFNISLQSLWKTIDSQKLCSSHAKLSIGQTLQHGCRLE